MVGTSGKIFSFLLVCVVARENVTVVVADCRIEHHLVHLHTPVDYADVLDRHVIIETAADSETHIRFVPVEVTAVYDIVITGVENLVPGTDVSAALTGMAEAWNPANRRPAGADVTIPFALDQDGPDCLRGSLLSFGDNAPHDVRHVLRVYASYKYYDFDVSDQIHNAADSRHVMIQLHGLRLPGTAQGGMSPGIDGWENGENIDITM